MAIGGAKGNPNVNNGTIAAELAALLADSGPATPSTAPLPNSSGLLLTFFQLHRTRTSKLQQPAQGLNHTGNPRNFP